ncbi:hypothetical protein B0J13DRAFT_626799 [Dactylonectria estremocensis]|uniref:DUF2306 domain-containing protein n=1 Tax=Dactylonectria estremocensis TaxID=1079267 RepID=A0A9P9E4F5_9HYPO|nr:hypothetical protein B0J13DRAFT_626799 [Dactylonectria estremocensis]
MQATEQRYRKDAVSARDDILAALAILDKNPETSSYVSRTSTDGRWWLLTSCALSIAAYGIYFLFGTPPGDPVVKTRMLSTPYGWFHVTGGLTAMATGPFQFLKDFRRRKPQAHRIIGRVYAVAVVSSAISGFWVSFGCLAHPIGRYGFAILALLWLISISLAMRSIWQRDIDRHRDWMTRNYALTYAAVMLRWQLPLYIFLGLSAVTALTVTSFSSWMPNLVFAEWFLRRHL